MIIPILVATVASLGLGLILSDLLHVPSFAVSKSTHNLGKRQNKKTNPIELWLKEIAGTLAGKLKINEYKRLQLEADLRTADIPMTPEQYIANCIVKSGFVALFAIPLFFVSKLLALIALGASVLMYVNESRKVSNRIKERRRKIEADLPMLSSTIEKSLERSRDIITILDNFKENAGPELRRELEITVADMRSGTAEVALSRLAARVGGSMMPDIVMGLKSTLNGDNTAVYWALLNIKFAEAQRTALKAEASKAPKRVKRLSMVLLVCFMLIYVVVIGQTLLSSLGGLFG